MSERWPGGIVRSTPVTPAGPLQNGAASGVWSLADAAYWTKQGLWPTAGNTLAVEDVFSTWLYTGTGAAQTITNGINLSGQGGMVWLKDRTQAYDNGLFDTARGAGTRLISNSDASENVSLNYVSSFNSNGFSLGAPSATTNNSGDNYASWTFREAPNFFDVVTYTGNGANRNIAHNLGVAPGMIIIKRRDDLANWQVYHRSNANTQYMVLNSTAAVATGATRWNSTTPTATEFTVGTDNTVNFNGSLYVAYLFAHDATSDGIIQCGSYTGNGSATGPVITLGWEPQWVMIKRANSTGNWQLIDNMRGMPVGSADATLQANLANAESSVDYVSPTATGFQVVSTSSEVNTNASTYIYIAIRRGPMKTPTLGTSVFNPVAYTEVFPGGVTVNTTLNGPDWAWFVSRQTDQKFSIDRLRGNGVLLDFPSTSGDNVQTATSFAFTGQTSFFDLGAYGNGKTVAGEFFKRAPGFFDVVAYTGTGSATTFNHNLGVAPQIVIIKRRSSTSDWTVMAPILGFDGSNNVSGLSLNLTTQVQFFSSNGGSTNFSPTVFPVSGGGSVNGSGDTYVAYLFASCPGVSKVGTYTGNGSSQTINCGFAAGARFVMIKRTDSTGNWLVWDTARGIVAGNDPYLELNTYNAEVTSNDSVDTDNTGFIVNQVAASNVNVNGATYIFLAVA
jgi:hypothetical protein